MTDTDKIMCPQHFGTDLTDIWIQNSRSRLIRKSGFESQILAMALVYALWVLLLYYVSVFCVVCTVFVCFHTDKLVLIELYCLWYRDHFCYFCPMVSLHLQFSTHSATLLHSAGSNKNFSHCPIYWSLFSIFLFSCHAVLKLHLWFDC